MPILPPPPARKLTPAEAGAIMAKGRKLLRLGHLTAHQLALLDCLLWSCRVPSTGAITVSYTRLQKLAHQARSTVSAGLTALQRVGLLSRIKRRVRTTWANGGTATRQAANAYLLHPPTALRSEFAGRTVIQRLEIISSVAAGAVQAARAALTEIGARRDAEFLATWRANRNPSLAIK